MLAIGGLLLLSGCGSSEDEALIALQRTQSDQAMALAEDAVETGDLIVRNGRFGDDQIEFPPRTARRIGADLKEQQERIDELVELPPQVAKDLTNARRSNLRALMGMRLMDKGLQTAGAMMRSGSSEQEVLSIFPDIDPLGNLIDQHMTEAMDRAVDASEGAFEVLEDIDEATPEAEKRVEDLDERAESVKVNADTVGDDRADIVEITRTLVKRRFKQREEADLASRLPDEACGSIPQDRHLATAVDIVVYAITSDCEDAMDIADVLYSREAFRRTGEWNDGEVICETHGVSENLITECETPVGDIAFTGPGSA